MNSFQRMARNEGSRNEEFVWIYHPEVGRCRHSRKTAKHQANRDESGKPLKNKAAAGSFQTAALMF